LHFLAPQIFNHKYRKSSTTEAVEPKFTGAEGRTRTGTSVNPLDFEIFNGTISVFLIFFGF